MLPRTHISLYVSDIKKTVAFYNQFFETKAIKQKSEYAKYIIENPAMIISFIENESLVNPQFGHLGIEVDNSNIVQHHLKRLQKAGFQVKEEMNTSCCYALQDKFWVKDPDGYSWEIYFFHSDIEMDTMNGCCETAVSESEKEACCTTDCCS